ncbi:hypothetical protein E5288_WYG010474 [Bos mutus]|uniref:Uncharacterized protein n=1 Tax=Bos mutus TaxID=72004 RepID=A0A6B0RZP0_9CETA|nr:hypothetical protein [Bos mutus]
MRPVVGREKSYSPDMSTLVRDGIGANASYPVSSPLSISLTTCPQRVLEPRKSAINSFSRKRPQAANASGKISEWKEGGFYSNFERLSVSSASAAALRKPGSGLLNLSLHDV